jgi:tRNA intron endonuclease, N-terminal domain.
MKGDLLENRIIIWNIADSKALFVEGYYGKPIGMTKPKPDEINVPLILDLIEGYYLQEKSRIKVYQSKKPVAQKELLRFAEKNTITLTKNIQSTRIFVTKGIS